MKKILLGFFGCLLATQVFAQVTANSCNTSDVQTAINSATAGETVNVPSGTCTWTSGVTASGVTLSGAGAGRVIAVDLETTAETLGTGTKTFNAVVSDTGATNYLTNASVAITNGETLRIMEDGWAQNYMQGTVSSFTGGVLTMSISSYGGTCGSTDTSGMSSNCKRWLVTTLPSTILCNNFASAGIMFDLTESTSAETILTGFFIGNGTDSRCSSDAAAGNQIYMQAGSSGALPILIHDNFIERAASAETIDGDTNQGVIWNTSFVASQFGTNQDAAIRVKDPNGTYIGSSWSTAADWGNTDTNGRHALYFETNDVHAYSQGWLDCDDFGKMVVRYNFMDNTGGASHGADTSYNGCRTLDFDNNAGWFQGYSDGTTANITWWQFIRGGTFVFFDNVLPVISSSDWGAKDDLELTVMTLQRDDQYPCWGAGFGSSGQYYPAPRQIGFGYVTGSGTVTYPSLGYNGSSTTSNGTYVGDSEPIYLWDNYRTYGGSVTAMTLNVADYCSSVLGSYNCGGQSTYCPNSPEPDVTAAYFQSGRDYYNNGTAKPSFTAAVYPNPLEGATVAATLSGVKISGATIP